MTVRVQLFPTQIDGHRNLQLLALTSLGRVIGTAKVTDWGSEPVLTDLFVEPTHRRSGIGSRLIEAGIDATAEADRPLHVYYLPDSPAREILERAGFEDTGHRGVDGLDGDYIWASLTRVPR